MNASRKIILIAHNIRSAHNVGSLLRLADGLGVEKVFLSGYTPYPHSSNDARLPHIAARVHARISKTSLGAESMIKWQYVDEIAQHFDAIEKSGYVLIGLEQGARAVPLPEYAPGDKIALLLGEEVHGLSKEYMARCKHLIEIPMFGRKESYNVATAAAMALYHIRFS